MKTTLVTTLLGVAAAAAVVAAPAAQADTDPAAYLGSLDRNGVHYGSPSAAVNIGMAVCTDLRQGAHAASEIQDLIAGSNGAMSVHDAGVIVGASAATLCPDQNARVQAEAAAMGS